MSNTIIHAPVRTRELWPPPLKLHENVRCRVAGLRGESPGTVWVGYFKKLKSRINEYIFQYDNGVILIGDELGRRWPNEGRLRIWVCSTGEEYDLSNYTS